MIADVTGIVEKSAPVNDVVTAINQQLDAGVDLLEGLLVKKAGLEDAIGLVDGLYPGAGAAGFRNVPGSDSARGAADRRGLHQGHAHPRAARSRGADRAASPDGPVLRNTEAGSLPRDCCIRAPPDEPGQLAPSPVIGTDAPVQYEQRDDIGSPPQAAPQPFPS